jgi:hypothetical protein
MKSGNIFLIVFPLHILTDALVFKKLKIVKEKINNTINGCLRHQLALY